MNTSKHIAIYKKINLYIILTSLAFLIAGLGTREANAQMPSSDNYQIQEYSFGSGGTGDSTSESYGLQGALGEVEFGMPSSSNYKIGSGLTYLLQANVPPAPTLSNPGTNYDRLKIVIQTGNNPTDATFAVAISTDNFVSDTRFVKNDNTIGSTLSASDYRTYTSWGDSSGSYITGLSRNTTYYVRAQAITGDFTESAWGPASTGVATADPSLTFSVDASAVTFNNLNSGNSYTDNSKTTTITTSTNAYNGYVVNARETQPLTAGATTIPDYSSPNSAPTTWSGLGFGYTTSDNDLTGGTADRFTNGGAHYAGFTTSSPGDPVADNPGPLLTPVTNEQVTISYRVTTNSSQQAASYTTEVLYIVVPSY